MPVISKRVARDRALSAKEAIDRMRELRPPIWIRAPVRGTEYWTGFSRSKLYQLEKDGKIRSKAIKEPGQKSGTRLFELASILAFIESNGKSGDGQ